MLVKTYTAAVVSIDAQIVTVEVSSEEGCGFSIVGLPDTAVRESYDRITTALGGSGFNVLGKHTVINLSPADLKKEGTAYDLPMAVGLVAANGLMDTERIKNYMLIGELSLDGTLRPVKGALPIAIKAREAGFTGLVVPRGNGREAGVVNQLHVYEADTLYNVVQFLQGKTDLPQIQVDTRAEFAKGQQSTPYDFSEVKGQDNVKRALEVAAAGGHNILMIGSPGSGKSMMAKRVPGILPSFTLSESLESTKIYSVAGKLPLNTMLLTERPFRAPHHSISMPALVGGGSTPKPGEISLAHNGVLFLDELAEFNRSVLELLRQPMEERCITVSRAKATVDYPASFMLVAAMNPCPCGYYNHPTKQCTCPPGTVQKYLSRVSGPLMDRVDIQIEIAPVPFEKISNDAPAESSASIRQRVVAARRLQTERFRNCPGVHCNAQMGAKETRLFATPDADGLNKLERAMNAFGLSARAYDRILKVARTIADLDNAPSVTGKHIAEAIGYRSLDRDSWGR